MLNRPLTDIREMSDKVFMFDCIAKAKPSPSDMGIAGFEWRSPMMQFAGVPCKHLFKLYKNSGRLIAEKVIDDEM